MKERILSESITKYRKILGMTQEELGKAVGVSTQAVSKWECGGTPDVELIPVIADTLKVSIEALFGREVSEIQSLEQRIDAEIARTKEEHRMNRVYELCYSMMKSYINSNPIYGKVVSEMFQGVHQVDRKAHDNQVLAYLPLIKNQEGIMEAGIADDIRFFFVMPEPKEGYASVLRRKEDYHRLFQLMAAPLRFDVLVMIYSTDHTYVTADFLADQLKAPLVTVTEALEDLNLHNFLFNQKVATAQGEMVVYQGKENEDLIPFLYFASQFMEDMNSPRLLLNTRIKPLMNAELGTGNCTPDWKIRKKGQEGSFAYFL